MRILFCTDGSKTSYNSISNFSMWVKDFSAEILSVSDVTYLPDSVLFDGNKYLTECKNSTNSIIEYSQEYLTKENIKISGIHKLCGNAVDSILETEQKKYYECIVMGSNGKKGLQKWLGSVSQQVASASKSNVYISKSKQTAKNILLPITQTPLSEDVIVNVIKNIDFSNANVHLLNVYEMPEFLFLEGNIDSNWINDVERQQQKYALTNLLKVEKLFMANNIKIENKTVIGGNPAEKILEYIILNGITLTVTGMRNRNAFSGILMSSVSRRILEYAQCDVLIIKEK